jgi:hypothetical protein
MESRRGTPYTPPWASQLALSNSISERIVALMGLIAMRLMSWKAGPYSFVSGMLTVP